MALSVLSSTGGRKSCLTLSLAQSRRARRRKSCLTLPPPDRPKTLYLSDPEAYFENFYR